jgi:hypothetical protein
MKNFILLVLSLTVLSCSKSDTPSSIDENGYLKLTLDGNNYSQDNLLNIAGTGGGNGDFFSACSGKRIWSQYFTNIENSSFSLTINLVHFQNATDFGTPSPATFNVFSTGGIDIFTYNYCYNNLTLVLGLKDKSTSRDCILQTGSTNKINSITAVPSASDSVSICYAIVGEFTTRFKYPNGTIKTVNGTYKTFIRVLK